MTVTGKRPTYLKATYAILLTSCCAIAFAEPAQAQASTQAQAPAQDTSVLDEIIVTATRRNLRLSDVPLSIQAISGADLERQGAVNFADYGRTVAGVSFIDAGPGRSQIFIRGVSTGGDVDTGKESTVGVYIDETPVTEGSSQPDLKLYDIDHIEVLRGPQGSLYGSGSLGGTVRVLTNQPDFNGVSSYIQALGSSTHEGGSNGAVNGWVNLPINDKLALRAVAYTLHNDGFLDNGFSGARDINDEDTYGGRLALRFQPTEALNVVLTGLYQRSDIGAYNRVTDHFPDLVIDQSAPEPSIDQHSIVNVKVDWDLGFARLTSSTSHFDRRRRFENDIDYFLEAGFGIPRGYSPLTYEAATTSQELRLASNGEGRLQWVAGAFYLHRDDGFNQTINILGTPPAATPGGNLYYADTRLSTEQLAGFGEVSYDLSAALTATVGLRVSRTNRDTLSVRDGPALGGRSEISGDFDETSTTPKFNLSFKPNENSLFYVQAAKGFRIGGINPGLPPCGAGCVVPIGDTFGSDTLWNYEAGAKLNLLDRRLNVTAAAFYIDWTDIQLNVSRGDGFNGFMNAGDATTSGFEVEASGRISEHFRLGGQVTFTDAQLENLAPGVMGVAAEGDRLPDVARWNAAANAEWGTAVFDNGYVYVRGDFQYVGDRVSSLGVASLPLEAYTLVNLRVGLEMGGFEGAIFVTNLTDERAELSRSQVAGVRDGSPIVFDRYTVNVPRTAGVSLSRRF
ncbi:TonB-dependent receptor [Brevundimonas diminuta]|uniref:TonB-dependent receptor n=1 Tax=Brevundimonas diminuta TaxID=293 RepID=UPI0020983149|nr:TonB-dependent receptor [Brevundimonas diminuta]MCO8031280.1 TonB-dependent receptor [Brevundimonas diminuta]